MNAEITQNLPGWMRKARLTTPELSEYFELVHGITLAPATLEKRRCVGGGPPFQRLGRAVFYPRAAADDWAAEQLGQPLNSTSEAS